MRETVGLSASLHAENLARTASGRARAAASIQPFSTTGLAFALASLASASISLAPASSFAAGARRSGPSAHRTQPKSEAVPSYRLNDPRILGEYVLVGGARNSEVKKVEIRFDVERRLAAFVDRNDGEYELTGPDAAGLVHESEGEPNCDGDETSCEYDASVKIWLTKGADGNPRLRIEISVVDAFDDSAPSTDLAYDLAWSRELPNAIPLYAPADNPYRVRFASDDCVRATSPYVGVATSNQRAICLDPQSYRWLGRFDEAFESFVSDRGSRRGVQAVSKEELAAQVFQAAERRIARTALEEAENGEGERARDALLAQFRKMQAEILRYDRFYVTSYVNSRIVYAISDRETLITQFWIDVDLPGR